jgi:hypothetical protein
MDNIAEAWLVYRLTGSSLLLGTVAFAGQIPVFLLAPIGGMVADRWNRQRVVIATQAISMVLAGILAVLTLSHRITVWEVVVLAALMGAVNAFDIPARQAFLVDMVGREDLMNAIALNSSMFNGARVIGPSIAGILVASLGEGWCFAANSISYIAVIIGLLLMHVKTRFAVRAHRRRIPICLEHRADTSAVASIGTREPGGDAVLGADADFCGENLARECSDARCSDGCNGRGCARWGADAGYAIWSERPRTVGSGRLCQLRHVSNPIFTLALVRLVRGIAGSGGVRNDGANGVVEYPDSGHGTRPASRAGDGSVLDDVYGDGADGRAAIGLVSGSHWGTMDADDWRSRRDHRRGTFRPQFT